MKSFLLSIVFTVLGIASLWAHAEQVRYHGMPLNDQYDLHIEQYDSGVLKIGLRGRSRPVGGIEAKNVQLEAAPSTGRVEEVTYLAQLRTRITRPAPANYLQTRGTEYLIEVEGIGQGPRFFSRKKVPAGDARATVTLELAKLRELLTGIEAEAIRWADPVVLGVLKQSKMIPAPIPETVKHTNAASIRIAEDTLAPRALPGGRPVGIGPGGEPEEYLVGRERVEAEKRKEETGGPTERAGRASLDKRLVRAAGIKPDYRPGGRSALEDDPVRRGDYADRQGRMR